MELHHVPPIVSLTIPPPNTEITGTKQHARSTGTELSEHRADGDGIVAWNGLFIVSIGGGDGLGKLRLKRNIFNPIEVWFISVVCRTSGRWIN